MISTRLSGLAASINVFVMYPLVLLTQYGVNKIMKMIVLLFSKFIHIPCYLSSHSFCYDFLSGPLLMYSKRPLATIHPQLALKGQLDYRNLSSLSF